MRKWIFRVLILICLGVFGYSAFMLMNITEEKEEANVANGQEIMETMVKADGFEPDWDVLREEFPDIVGWIYVPDCGPTSMFFKETKCSYAVVQGGDNYFYLNHAANQEPYNYGACFLNAGQPYTLTDDNTILYGHSSDDGAMMTNIYNFCDEQFFVDHPYFYYFTPEQNYRCAIYCFAKDEDAGTYYETNFGEYQEREDILDYWQSHALYSRAMDVSESRFLTISTCNVKEYGFYSDQRLILVGALEPYNLPIEIKK